MAGNSTRSLLQVAIEAAAAGASVLRERQGHHLTSTVKHGEAGNIVTNVDLLAEEAVRAVLRLLRADDEVSGEEFGVTSATDARYRWSIDPLDGTTNFTRGIPYFATSVAVQHVASGEWIAGVVDAPALGKTYFASRGGGAFVRGTERGATERRLEGPPPGRTLRLLGTGFSYNADIRHAQYLELDDRMRDFADLRRFGSAALAICAVAEGATDAFHEADLQEYDWAAAALIAEEAGLAVTRPRSAGESTTVG